MTTDIKELARWLRVFADEIAERAGQDEANNIASAADALEAMAGEVERLTELAYGIGSATIPAWSASKKHAELTNKMLGEAEAERDRLKAVLKPRLNAKAVEGLQEILEAMEAMDEREAPFLKTLLDWHEASRKALGDAS